MDINQLVEGVRLDSFEILVKWAPSTITSLDSYGTSRSSEICLVGDQFREFVRHECLGLPPSGHVVRAPCAELRPTFSPRSFGHAEYHFRYMRLAASGSLFDIHYYYPLNIELKQMLSFGF